MNLLVSKLRIAEITESVQIYNSYLKGKEDEAGEAQPNDWEFDDKNFNIEVNNVNFCQ